MIENILFNHIQYINEVIIYCIFNILFISYYALMHTLSSVHHLFIHLHLKLIACLVA